MVDPDRAHVTGRIEVDETVISYRTNRTKDDPSVDVQGLGHFGRLPLAGAVEIVVKEPGRFSLSVIQNYSAASLHAFIEANTTEGAIADTDNWPAYPGALGVGRGLRRLLLQVYLDEFVSCFNRHRTPRAAVRNLLRIGTRIKHAT